MIDLSSNTVIICGIVRDAEKGLRRNIPVINKLVKLFRDFRVIIYENDSKDATKELLTQWHESDSERIHVSLNMSDSTKTIPSRKSVGTVNPFFCYKRIEKMARLRNNYMNYVDNKGWSADFLIVVDLDVSQLYLSGILSSFINDDWDAVCAFGYSTSPKLRRRYHDSYALTMLGDEQNPQTEERIALYSDKYGSMKLNDEWLRVASGFGGLTIYRFEAIKGLRYQVLPNNDSRVEVKCEHYSIYKQMAERGYNHIYINPAMTLKYQDLTFSIIWNSLKRKFGFLAVCSIFLR